MSQSNRPLLRTLVRILVVWAVSVLGLIVMIALLDGFSVSDLVTGILFVLVVALLNALLWPLLSRVLLPFMVFTLGLGSFILNGLLFWLASEFFPGVTIDSLWTAILASIGVTVVVTIVSALLTIDDDASYYRNALKRNARRRRRGQAVSEFPGVIFLEIDGLGMPILERALKNGYMPTLKRWLDSGDHRLMEWETDTSCQTGGCQAGILHGDNSNIPAFRWVEKDNDNRVMTSTGPADAPEIERRISDGNGLLSINGYSRTNLFSGDAEDAVMTFSRVTQGGIYTPAFHNFFIDPYNFTRALSFYIWDIVREIRSRRRQAREDVWPRLGREERGGIYPLVRAFLTVLAREVNTYTLIGDVFEAKADAIYVTYAAYDELAHHSGVEDIESLEMLTRLDKDFARIEKAVEEADRPYEFVVLSDHGQSKGATFKQRYHMTLEEHIRSLLPAELKIHSRLETNEGWDAVSGAMTDAVNNDSTITGTAVRTVTRTRQSEEGVIIGPEQEQEKKEASGELVSEEDAHVIVLASGNFGLVYFTDWQQRMSFEQLNEAYPNLIRGLVEHEGVGFVMVRSEENGGTVIGERGAYYLDTDQFVDENPLADFRPRAAQHLRRTDGFKNVPDIVVNSFYDEVSDEGAAFEELIGFHGGLGGDQSRPFLLFPAGWNLDEEEIIGAEHVYQVLKAQLVAYQDGQAAQG